MNENAKKWVAALRSGEYQQAKSRLFNGTGFCCLGVACDLYAKETGGGEWAVTDRGDWEFIDTAGVLPPEVKDWLGLRTSAGEFVEETEDEYGNRSMNVLTAKNDSGASFEQIAYLIESMPEELFNE